MWLEQCAPHGHMRQFLDRYFGIDGCLFCTQIVDIGFGSLFRLAHAHGLTCNNPGNLAPWVMHIARDDGPFWANDDTGWLQANFRTMGTIVALGRGLAVGINVERVIGACLHAGLTANTTLGIEIDDAVPALKESLRRANSDTRSIGAVIAAVDKKIAPRVGELAFFDIFDPRAIK